MTWFTSFLVTPTEGLPPNLGKAAATFGIGDLSETILTSGGIDVILIKTEEKTPDD